MPIEEELFVSTFIMDVDFEELCKKFPQMELTVFTNVHEIKNYHGLVASKDTIEEHLDSYKVKYDKIHRKKVCQGPAMAYKYDFYSYKKIIEMKSALTQGNDFNLKFLKSNLLYMMETDHNNMFG